MGVGLQHHNVTNLGNTQKERERETHTPTHKHTQHHHVTNLGNTQKERERERETHTYTQTHTAPSCHELGQYTHKEGERLTHLHSDTSGCQSAFLCSVANVLLFPCLFFSDISGFQSLFSFFLLRKHLITKWAGGCVAEWEGCKVVWKIFFIWIFFVLFGCGAERVGCKSWSTLINYSWQKCNQLSLRVDLILTRRVSIYWKRWK